jgi:DNA-binding NtrC family response regulator
MTLQQWVAIIDPPRRRNILLVEDEPFVREATCSILQRAGFDVLLAKDFHEGLAVYKIVAERNDPSKIMEIDMVMTDMILPGGTGEQLAAEIHQRSPAMTVLVTSGYSNLEYETESPGSHTFFLAKPYSRRTLLEKIERILEIPPPLHLTAQAG